MADFNILQTPNFGQAVLSGYHAGQTLGKQQRLDTALDGVDLERPETIIPILKADPHTGAALLGTSLRYAEMKHEQNKANAIGSALSDYFSGGAAAKPAGTITANVPAMATTPVAPAPDTTGAPAMPSAAPDNGGDVVITANKPQPAAPDAGKTIATMVQHGASLEDAQKFVSVIGSLSDQHKATLVDAQDAIGHAALQLHSLSADKRRAALDAMAPELLQHHVTQQQIENADLSDGGLQGIWNQTMAVKDVLAGNRDDAKFAYQQKHDATQDRFRQQEISISAGNLGVSRKRLSDEEKGILGKDGKTPIAGAQDNLPQPMTQAAFNDLKSGTTFRAPDGTVRVKP